MSNEALQFVFSLFSLVGVVGIIFYLILQQTKLEKLHQKIEDLEDEMVILKDYTHHLKIKKSEQPQSISNNTSSHNESTKEKIIALYEQGVDTISIENQLNVPRATIEMVLKFHTMNKTDNWRDSVN
jgi:hypothetical protein